jgi:hypothetical protein
MTFDIEDVQRLRVEAGDMIVIHLARRMSQSALSDFARALEDRLPKGVHAIVLEPGATLEVVGA